MSLEQWSRVVCVMAACGCFTGALAQPAAGQENDWVVTPPARLLDRGGVLPNSPALVKSLGDAAEYVLRWKLPQDAEGWRKRRPEVERAFRKAIGLEKLPERTPLKSRTVARHDMGDYTVENVVFESRPGFPVSANLYRSKSRVEKKSAAILSPIGHFLSAGKRARDVQARCIQLARMGFIVLTYDAIGQGERMVPGNIHHEGGYALLPLGETVAGWMVWDSMRAIDYLLTLPEVDAARIGVTGNSGGGLNTLYTAALDERVRAAVVVGYTFEFNNWLKYAGTHCACTHLPGVFRAMEWFEIAGLIAPRALMMLQGENDGIFPISGARRAANNTAALFSLLGEAGRVRFDELAGQPHAYTQPYRERMYAWMAQHLLAQERRDTVPEGPMDALSETDPRLLCDGNGTIFPKAPTVIDLARSKALETLKRLDANGSEETQAATRRWVEELTAPPEPRPHYLAAGRSQNVPSAGRVLEKVSFVSEDGEYIPGLLWTPAQRSAPGKTVMIVDSRGKAAVAESPMVQPLLEAGFTVFVLDLRGRGETLGQIRPGWDINFRLVANQVLFGRPLAGRRAFDLLRAVDYLRTRKSLASDEVAAVGLRDDALPVLLAAAADTRIGSVAVAEYLHSFVSQMQPRAAPQSDLPAHWNDPQLDGRVRAAGCEIDFGSVIPSALERADLPDLAALIAPRRVLFANAADQRAPDAEALAARFRRVAKSVRYEPRTRLDGALLVNWLRAGKP